MKFILFLCCCLIPTFLMASSLTSVDPEIGKVNGVMFRLSDLEDKEVNDLRIKLYQTLTAKLKAKALDELAKGNQKYRDFADVNVSDKEAKHFFNQNGLAQRGSYTQLKPQIVQFLRVQKMKEQVNRLYLEAVEQGKVVPYLKEPAVLQVSLPIETAYLWGNQKAGVMLLEFSDYQCPFCGRVQPSMVAIRNAYKKKVLFGYRHFPLQFHKQADDAALAVECAREQGKFDPYHVLLFANQSAQFDKDLIGYAQQVGVKDQAQFSRCLKTKKYQPQIQHDMEQASSIGVRGTPSFLIGHYDPKSKQVTGELLSGAMPKEQLISVLNKYLAQ